MGEIIIPGRSALAPPTLRTFYCHVRLRDVNHRMRCVHGGEHHGRGLVRRAGGGRW